MQQEKYAISNLVWRVGRDNYETADELYKIRNWVSGYEKGFGFVKTSEDKWEVTKYNDLQITSRAIFTSSSLQGCLDFLNKKTTHQA